MKVLPNTPLPFHYAWVIAAVGTFVIFACLGLGRFALGMLLPSMAPSLGLSYSQIGFISTGNFIGYLVAVLFCSRVSSRIGLKQLIVLSLFLIAVSMILISRAASFHIVLILYFLTGLGSGWANVPMMGLITVWFDRTLRGRAAGFVVIGSGLAILMSGKLIPTVNRAVGADGWRTNWAVMGIIVAAAAVAAALLLRNRPQDKGLLPLGSERRLPAFSALQNTSNHLQNNRPVFLLSALYFLFGYTYVIYATFIVTNLVKEHGFSEATAGNFWSWVGILSLFSGPLFGTLSDRIGRKAGLMIVFALQAAAYLLAGLQLPVLFVSISIGLFGICAWSVPSIMIAAVSEYAGTEQTLKVFGFVTFVFGLGQIIGPAVAGILAERTGSFSGSFIMAAVFTALAVIITSFLPKPQADMD